MVAEIAVVVGGALPDADRGQMRRLERRHLPLVHRVVGDAREADLAAAPGLPRRPLDAGVEVLCLAGRPEVEEAGRSPRPAGVHAAPGGPVRHPPPQPGVRPAGAIVPCASSLAEAGVSSENSERWAGQRATRRTSPAWNRSGTVTSRAA